MPLGRPEDALLSGCGRHLPHRYLGSRIRGGRPQRLSTFSSHRVEAPRYQGDPDRSLNPVTHCSVFFPSFPSRGSRWSDTALWDGSGSSPSCLRGVRHFHSSVLPPTLMSRCRLPRFSPHLLGRMTPRPRVTGDLGVKLCAQIPAWTLPGRQQVSPEEAGR